MEWIINNKVLAFEEDTHTYYYNGIKVQSVTQLLGRKFGNKYDNIPADVLKAAAEYGTKVHKAIECYVLGFDDGSDEVRNYKFLQNYYNFTNYRAEAPVVLTLGGKTYAGRLDLILDFNGEKAIADIKTTSTLDREYLGHQLNLYRLGVEQSYGMKVSSLYGIHLRGTTRKLVSIPIKEEEWLLKSLGLTETE